MEVTDEISNTDDFALAREVSGHTDRYDRQLSDDLLKVAPTVYIIPIKYFGKSLTEHPAEVTKQTTIGKK